MADASAGTGSDTLVLRVNEDAYQGDANFTVSIDGKPIGGTFTTSALHSRGVTDAITLMGDFAPGQHTAAVVFTNDAYGGTATADRNFYLVSATYNGTNVANAAHDYLSQGSYSLNLNDTTVLPNGSPPTPTTTRTIGSGSDTFLLRLSEDAYQGDAQFTVAVDDRQIGGTQTAKALHSTGSNELLEVKVDLAPGTHTLTTTFLQDAYGGSLTADRNLYLESVSYNGTVVNNGAHSFLSAESYSSTVFDNTAVPGSTTAPPPTSTPVTTTVGSGSDTLTLKILEEYYQGDAQFTVSIDGKQIGGTLTAKALLGSDTPDTVIVKADLAPGNHSFSVHFANDAWGGTATTDRNLYIDSATYNGVALANVAQSILSGNPDGRGSFTDNTAVPGSTTTPPPSSTPTTTTIGSGSDTLTLKISEDYYQGDAQFTVSIDGRQIGGTLTSKALHGSGSDTVIVKADLTPGTHNFSVHFLNDAWGGTAATDRNLHIDSATYNGVALANVAQSIETESVDGRGNFTDNTAVPGAVTTPAPAPSIGPSDINILNRGQSNSLLFDTYNGIYQLADKVAAATGARVHVLAANDQTEFSGTAFMDWDTDGQQAKLVNYLKGQSADIRDNPTITLWMHNEYDQGNQSLTQSQWVGEVQADAALVRSALGQTAATTPYLFAPIRYPYGSNFDPIGKGMAQLDADARFNARVTYDASANDVLMNGGPEAGNNSSHISVADASLIASKLVDEMVAIYNQDIV